MVGVAGGRKEVGVPPLPFNARWRWNACCAPAPPLPLCSEAILLVLDECERTLNSLSSSPVESDDKGDAQNESALPIRTKMGEGVACTLARRERSGMAALALAGATGEAKLRGAC